MDVMLEKGQDHGLGHVLNKLLHIGLGVNGWDISERALHRLLSKGGVLATVRQAYGTGCIY